MTKQKRELFGKRVALEELDDIHTVNRVFSELERSINDALTDANKQSATARVTKVQLDISNYECFVSVEVAP